MFEPGDVVVRSRGYLRWLAVVEKRNDDDHYEGLMIVFDNLGNVDMIEPSFRRSLKDFVKVEIPKET